MPILNEVFLSPIALVKAAGVTLFITIMSSTIGTVGGVVLWWLSQHFARCVIIYICDGLRIVPNLVLIFLVYYFPYASIGLMPPGPIASATTGLLIAQAAYSFDVTRTSFPLVSKAQVDGLKSIGASNVTLLRYVYVPNMIRLSWAPHVALWIGNLKLSSLASVIGAPDLSYFAKAIAANSFQLFDAWVAITFVYVGLCAPFVWVGRRLERLPFFSYQ